MKTDHITGGTSATHATKRLGRGRGNGRGKTCCRGHKGSGQRSGYSTKPGFEGGQYLYTAAFLNAVSTIQTFAPSTLLST